MHLWCFALSSAAGESARSEFESLPPAAAAPSPLLALDLDSASFQPSDGIRRIAREQSGRVVTDSTTDEVRVDGASVRCHGSYASSKSPRLETILQLLDASLQSFWRRRITQMMRYAHLPTSPIARGPFDPTLIDAYECRFFLELGALKVTFAPRTPHALTSSTISSASSSSSSSSIPSSLLSAASGAWGSLYRVRDSALLDLLDASRVSGVFHPAAALQKYLADMSPAALAAWCASGPGAGTSVFPGGSGLGTPSAAGGAAGGAGAYHNNNPAHPLLLWLALLAARCGLISRRIVRKYFPQLADALDAQPTVTGHAAGGPLSSPTATGLRRKHSHTTALLHSPAMSSTSLTSRPSLVITIDGAPASKKARWSSTPAADDSARSDRESGQGALAHGMPNELRLDSDVTSADDADAEEREFVLPRKRQEFLASKYLPPQPTYEAQLPPSALGTITNAITATTPTTQVVGPPPTQASLPHLYFPSLYAAQLTALSLQYNDSPATAAHHAFTNIQAVPNEFKRKPSSAAVAAAAAAAAAAHAPHAAAHAQAHGGAPHMRRVSSLNSEDAHGATTPSLRRIHHVPSQLHIHGSGHTPTPTPGAPAPRYESPHPQAHTPHHQPPGQTPHPGHASYPPHAPTTSSTFRPHIPSASTLFRRPHPPQPHFASAFVITVREVADDASKSPAPVPIEPPPTALLQRKKSTPPPLPPLSANEDASRKRKSAVNGSPSPIPPPLRSASPPLGWSELPPPPFCFFPWSNNDTRSTSRAATTARTHDTDDDTSDEEEEDGVEAQRAHSPDAMESTTPVTVPLHLCRFIQQQALAPLTRFSQPPRRRTSVIDSSNSSSDDDAGWLTLAAAASSDADADRTEEAAHRRARHLVTLAHMLARAFDVHAESGDAMVDTDGLAHCNGVTLGNRLIADPLPTSVTFLPPAPSAPLSSAAAAAAAASAFASSVLASPSPPPSHASAAPVAMQLMTEPRVLMSFEDSPGHLELRAYPPALVNWLDRAALRPFNPTLPGAWARPSVAALHVTSSAAASMHKNILFLVAPPVASFLAPSHARVDSFFHNLAAVYQASHLGRHTNLLVHSAPPNAIDAGWSPAPRSCMLDVRYARPTWLQDCGAVPRPASSPWPSPPPPELSPPDRSPMPSGSPIAHARATSPMPPLANPSGAAASARALSSSSSGFPPLLSVRPPTSGAQRYYQGLVWGVLQQLCGVVRNKEMAGSASGSGSLAASSAGNSSTPASRPPPLDFDRFDSLLLYVVDDGRVAHSLPMLSHYLSYLTESGKLLQEVEHLQEAQHAKEMLQLQATGAGPQLDAAAQSAIVAAAAEAPTDYDILFSESEKDCWTSALQTLEHLHVCIHFVPASALDLSPAVLRSRAISVYTQVCRLSDKVSLFLSDGTSLSTSVGMSVSDAPGAAGNAPLALELPPFPVWYEPIAILERAHKLPPVWRRPVSEIRNDWEDEPMMPSSATTSANHAAGSDADGGYALHIAYAFLTHANCLLAVLTDERGCIVHSCVLPAPAASARVGVDASSIASRAAVLQTLLARFLREHLRPMLLILPRTLCPAAAINHANTGASHNNNNNGDNGHSNGVVTPPARVRLVVAKLGSRVDAVDRAAWSALSHAWRWSASWKAESPHTSPLACSTPLASPLQIGSAHIGDVFLLSVLPTSSPHLTRAVLAPPFAPPVDFHTVAPSSVPNFDAEIARAKQTLATTIGAKAWWQTRGNAANATTAVVTHANNTSDGFGLCISQPNHHKHVIGSMAAHARAAGFAFASEVFFAAPPPVHLASTQRVSAKVARQASEAPHSPAAQVALVAYFSAMDEPIANRPNGTPCAVCAPAPTPSTDFFRLALARILAQWHALAALNPIDIDPEVHRHLHGARGQNRHGSGEPVPHLPMHLTVLTRMRALAQRV